MVEKGVRGLAIVNQEGQLIDSISAIDVKGLVYGDFFSDLRQPVLRYLSKARILLTRNPNPVVGSPEESLEELLKKMGTEKVNRVFVVDQERKPISVISLRDILKEIHANPLFIEAKVAPSTSPGGAQ